MQQIRSFLSAAWTSFRRQPRRSQAIIAAVAGVALIACCAIGSAAGNAGTTTNTTTANSHTSAVTHATATARPHPAVTPTLAPLAPPYVGGPYRNFTHAYGQPFGNSNNLFYPDSSQQVIIGVTQSNGLVSQVAVIQTPSGWTNAQVYGECALFLPQGATSFNHAGPYTDYHSVVGEVVIEADGGGVCTISTAPGA